MAKRATKTAPVPVSTLAQQSIRARELGRRHYAKADRLMDQIVAQAEVGEEIEISAGKKAVVIDEFASKTVVFKPTGFRRFALKVLDK